MWGAQEIAIVLGAIGGGAFIREAVSAVWRAATGREGRRRADSDAGWRARDREATKRRKLQEYATHLRMELVAAGVPMHELPPWPRSAPDTGPTNTKEKT